MNYNKEYKKYLISAILDNANNKIASTTLMTAFAVYLGIPDFWIGLYVVLDTFYFSRYKYKNNTIFYSSYNLCYNRRTGIYNIC